MNANAIANSLANPAQPVAEPEQSSPKTKQIRNLVLSNDQNWLRHLNIELGYRGLVAEFYGWQEVEQLRAKLQETPELPRTVTLHFANADAQMLRQLIASLRNYCPEVWILILRAASSEPNNLPLSALLELGADIALDQAAHGYNDLYVSYLKVGHRRLNSRNHPNQLEYYDLGMDLLGRRVSRSGKIIELRTKEFELLRVFLEHPEEILTRQYIFDQVWGSSFLGDSNVIEVYIRYLRTKLGNPGLIRTKRGKGYLLMSDEAMIKKAKLNDLDRF